MGGGDFQQKWNIMNVYILCKVISIIKMGFNFAKYPWKGLFSVHNPAEKEIISDKSLSLPDLPGDLK